MQLSLISTGHVHAADFEPLTHHLTRLEQVVTESDAQLNRAIDAAANDWILILRERETIDDALAREAVQSINAARAWGFRIRTVPLYAGKPLRIATDGELRLFHRRHWRPPDQLEGPVIRLKNVFTAVSFASIEEHRTYLQTHGVPHSWLRRTLIFLRNARTFDANTLRYIWIEAGFDHDERRTENGER